MNEQYSAGMMRAAAKINGNGGRSAVSYPLTGLKLKRLMCLITGGLLLLSSFSPSAYGDWSGFSSYRAIAEVRLESGRITVHLQIKQSALPEFARRLGVASDDPAQIAARMLLFRQSGSKAIGVSLISLKQIAKNPLGSISDPYVEAMLGADLGTTPGSLTIVPAPGLADKALGLVFLHKGVPTADLFAFEKPVTVSLDWNSPWRSHFDNLTLIRRHTEPRTYVYLDSHEVRQESVLRLSDVAKALDLGLKDARYIEPSERAELQKKIVAFVASGSNLLIDGRHRPGQIERVEFLAFDSAGLHTEKESVRLETAAAIAGVIQSYPTDTPPTALSLTWNIFAGEDQQRAVSVIQGQETFDGYVTRQQPQFDWSSEEAFEPVAYIEPARQFSTPSGELDPGNQAQLKEVLVALLRNVYAAFELSNDEAVYDQLAKSLDGHLLEDVYLQQRRALLQRANGLGGEGRVEGIDVTDVYSVSERNSREPEIRARWIAHGEVSHWGHSHPRYNAYEAVLKLHEDATQAWKIAGLQFIDEQNMQAATDQ